MGNALLIRGARQLLTLQGPAGPRRAADLRDLGIIQDGAVLIVDGIVRAVGSTRRVQNLSEAHNAKEIDASGRVVLPGFVDCHTHLVGGPPRLQDFEMMLAGVSEKELVEAGGGYPAVYKAVNETSPRTLEAEAQRVLAGCIRHGTTTLEAKSGYGGSAVSELKILRTHEALTRLFPGVVSTFMTSRCTPGGSVPTGLDYVKWLCDEMLPQVRQRRLARFADISTEEGDFTLEQARIYLNCAKALGFKLKLHAGQYWNMGGVPLGVEAGVVSVDHAVYVDANDAALLARSETIATLLPGPIFYRGLQRYASARMLIDRGVAVALASNYNPQTSPSYNMQMVISLACRKMG